MSPRVVFVAVRERVDSEDSAIPALKTQVFIPPTPEPGLGPRPFAPLPSWQSQKVPAVDTLPELTPNQLLRLKMAEISWL